MFREPIPSWQDIEEVGAGDGVSTEWERCGAANSASKCCEESFIVLPFVTIEWPSPPLTGRAARRVASPKRTLPAPTEPPQEPFPATKVLPAPKSRKAAPFA